MHWEVQEDELGWVTSLFEKTNFCTSCGSIWLPHPAGDDSLARPLAHPDHVQVTAPNRKFSWRTSFTIPDTADPSTATITYRLGFDDVSRNSTDTGNLSGCNHTVWLNGTPYELASTGTNIRTECEATIAAGSAFVTGENKLEFRIQNLATYYGFRLEKLSATYQGPSVCTPLCGNSMLDNNESCDDGNDTDSDGCNTSCEIEDGWGCEGEPSVCELLCGDGALDAGEVCDDGNDTDSDGCNTSCEIEDGWGCEGEPSVCELLCGDGALDAGEVCDDGNDTDSDGCNTSCEIEDGWGCEGEPSVCELLCGNGALDAGEVCDDGNDTDSDGCDATCAVEDGYSCTQDNAIGDLFSTGVDDSDVPVELTVMDVHWEVQEDELGWVTSLFEKTNFCTSCGSIWLPHPAGDDSLARPLAHPDHVQVTAPNRKFSWRTSFTIPDTADPSTATITYRLGFDDVSRNSTDTGNLSGCNHTVWLNETPYELASTGTNIRTECEATIAAGSAFVTG